MTEGHKYDGGKVRIELFPGEALLAISSVLTFGAKKYAITVENEWHALLSAQTVESVRVSTLEGVVAAVTRSPSGHPIMGILSASDRTDGIGRPVTQNASLSWHDVDKLIQQHVSETRGQSGSVASAHSGSARTSTPSSALPGARSADRPSTCTLTIATTQGNFEVSFAPDAIMASAFWTTTWRALSERFGISRPQNQTGDRNWERGMKWGRVFGAMMRHMWCWWQGKGPTTKSFLFGELDSESGFSHLWHAGCCVVFLITYEERQIGEDNRPR